MRDATYVLMALVMCSLIAVFVQLSSQKRPSMSFMELLEFKDLPYELRSVVRKMLPDPQIIRHQWKTFTADQKRMVIQQISQVMPQGPTPPPQAQPPAPTKGMKRGFLNPIHKNKKKNTEDKKEDEVATLAVVGTPEADGPTLSNDTPFLGSDD